MLFDEAELLTLDQVAVKNTTDKEKLKQKPAPLIDHWIGVDVVGNIHVLKKPKEQGVLTILKAQSMDTVNEVLSAVKNTQSDKLYSKGNFKIPNWKTVGPHIGFTCHNMIQLNVWLSKVITVLGYEKRESYSIVNDPSDVIDRINKKRGITPESLAKEQEEINAFLDSLNEDRKRKLVEDEQAQKAEQEKIQQRYEQIKAEQEEQLAYQQNRRNSDTHTEGTIV